MEPSDSEWVASKSFEKRFVNLVFIEFDLSIFGLLFSNWQWHVAEVTLHPTFVVDMVCQVRKFMSPW